MNEIFYFKPRRSMQAIINKSIGEEIACATPTRQRSPTYFLTSSSTFSHRAVSVREQCERRYAMAPNESRRHASCGGRNSISRLCRTSMLLGKQLSANAVVNETKGLRLFTGLFHGDSACGKCRLHERPALCRVALPFPRKP